MDRRKSDVARHSAPRSDFLPGADAGGAADRALRHERAPRLSDGAARQRTGRHHHQSARAAQARRAARSRVRVRRQVAGDSARAGSDRRQRDCGTGQDRPLRTVERFLQHSGVTELHLHGPIGMVPAGDVTDYATATLRLRVPEGYSSVASGTLEQGYPRALPPEGRTAWTDTASAPRSLSGISAGPRADSFMSTPHRFPSMQRMETTHR